MKVFFVRVGLGSVIRGIVALWRPSPAAAPPVPGRTPSD
jgi:hypothetical protein